MSGRGDSATFNFKIYNVKTKVDMDFYVLIK